MFKYIEFTKVKTDNTVLEFRGGNDTNIKINYFDVDVVSVEAENESDIDALISSQATEINCTEITQDNFKKIVAESAQLKRIREVVKGKIAEKYSLGDEIAILKKPADNVKRTAYNDYIAECLALGYGLKAEIGY